jgi:two-component system sensor histidine kinase UhpB
LAEAGWATPGPQEAAAPLGLRRQEPPSLFWRVFLVNASLLTVAAIVLVVTPATISFPATAHQLSTLTAGLVVMLAANALLLRLSLRPLLELTRTMRAIDPLMANERLQPAGAAELQAVATAFNEMLERLEEERRSSSTRVVAEQEEERRRLAVELHDEVGQRLTALLLQLRAVIDDAPADLVPRLMAAHELAHGNLDEIRRLAKSLRPAQLDDLGLGYALHGLLDIGEQNAPLEIVRRIDYDLPKLDPAAELVVYRIAQEAVTNVLRHAAATRVEVATFASNGCVVLEVHDNGRGMLYAADHESGGIRGMRERAIAVGGTLRIESRPGGGTSVSVSVPTPG